MKCQHFCENNLFSVEQETLMKAQPDIQEYYFPDILGTTRNDEQNKQALAEWENVKFYKH